MRFRPANIRLINRRSNLPRLLLALFSNNDKDNSKNNPTDVQRLTGSLHIREPLNKPSAFLQGLKPTVITAAFTARLKSCPFKTTT